MKKRFSMRNKLLIIFGLLIAAAAITEGLLAVRTARKAVTEKIETHLIDKAADTAEIIDGRITAFFQFLEGIARMPVLSDTTISVKEKIKILQKEAAFNASIIELDFSDLNGTVHSIDGDTQIGDREWFKTALNGKPFISEPLISRTTQKLIQIIAVPMYNNDRQIIGVLSADIDGLWLSEQIDDIVVGKTGECYILDSSGSTVADKDATLVKTRANTCEDAKTDTSLASCAAFEKLAVEIDEPSVGYFEYKGENVIASYAPMKTTDWTIIIDAPVSEFMGSVDELRLEMLIIGMVIIKEKK